jgi:hypothetical protein
VAAHLIEHFPMTFIVPFILDRARTAACAELP